MFALSIPPSPYVCVLWKQQLQISLVVKSLTKKKMLYNKQVREGGIRNVKEHFSLSNAAGGMAEMLRLTLENEDKAKRALELGAKAITMDVCY
jgi:hypothetical protein